MSYTSQVNVENLLKRELTSEEEAMLSLIFDSVDKFIDEQVGGSFGAVAETSRLYDGKGDSILDIHPCYDITDISIVDSEGNVINEYDLDTELETRPLNETIKRWLERRGGYFPRGIANIRVTAKFSLGAVPSDIEYLATYLVTKFYNDYISNNIESESIEGYSRKFGTMTKEDFIVNSILEKYSSDAIFF